MNFKIQGIFEFFEDQLWEKVVIPSPQSNVIYLVKVSEATVHIDQLRYQQKLEPTNAPDTVEIFDYPEPFNELKTLIHHVKPSKIIHLS